MTTEQEQAIEVLSKMEELLATPDRWTKEADARDECGHEIRPTDPDAFCFCLNGAATACGAEGQIYRLIDETLWEATGEEFWAESWNDAPERTHSEVLEVLAKAKTLIASGEVK